MSDTMITDEVERNLRELFVSSPEAMETDATDVPEVMGNVTNFSQQASIDDALIRYATQSCRLLFIEQTQTWNEIHQSNNLSSIADYSVEDLYRRFIEQVLPKIYTYNLSDEQKRLFELLDLHPEFQRCDDGYRRVPPEQRIGHSRQPKANVDFRFAHSQEEIQRIFNSQQHLLQTPTEVSQFNTTTRLPSQTLFTSTPYRQFSGYKFQFDKENAALLSAALSNDSELSACTLLEPEEVHKRLRLAKRDFEQSARMPSNCIDVNDLLGKIEKLRKLRAAIIDVVTKKYL